MIALAIIVALEAIVCISLEVRFEKLVRKHNELVHHTKKIAESTAEMGEALSGRDNEIRKAQDINVNIMEELFKFIKDVDSRVADVSHETKDIKSYYCNYVSKKGNE